jgi:methylmalonyl-CoA/ethylmalonyl-CoA epimerase
VTDILLDHLAIGVRAWADAYPRFAGSLGGAWSHGGDTGPFAPCQLVYPDGMRLEFIAPGSDPDGFMHRFIERSGPGPHHLTFTVPSLPDALEQVGRLGIEPLGGRTTLPFWKEAFLHPKQAAMGTLLQIVQVDRSVTRGFGSPPPPDFPARPGPARGIAWIGLTTDDLGLARSIFGGVLSGRIAESGPGWLLVTWGPRRTLLVRTVDARPGLPGMWPSGRAGVDHIVFGPARLRPAELTGAAARPSPMPHDGATGIPVWLVDDPAADDPAADDPAADG